MKKMYKNPKTEVLAVSTERMMDSVNVSTNPGGGGGGTAHAPARQGVAPAVPGDGL